MPIHIQLTFRSKSNDNVKVYEGFCARHIVQICITRGYGHSLGNELSPEFSIYIYIYIYIYICICIYIYECVINIKPSYQYSSWLYRIFDASFIFVSVSANQRNGNYTSIIICHTSIVSKTTNYNNNNCNNCKMIGLHVDILCNSLSFGESRTQNNDQLSIQNVQLICLYFFSCAVGQCSS